MKKNLGIFVKINTFGVIPIIIIVLFIIGIGFYSFTNTTFVYSLPEKIRNPQAALIYMTNSGFPPLMGILGGGYYLHNITLPIIRNSKNPENNKRDVLIGYFLVFISYIVCGSLGYYGFSGSYFFDYINRNGGQLGQNCLNMLDTKNALAIIVRFCTFCQLFAAMALLFGCQRA